MGCTCSRSSEVKKDVIEVKGNAKEKKKEVGLTNNSLNLRLIRGLPTDIMANRISEYRAERLVTLRLEDIDLGDTGAIQVAHALLKCDHGTTLKSLRVSACGIGSAGCAALAELLSEKNVLCLDLSQNAIDAHGVDALTSAVKKRESWTQYCGDRFELNLSDNARIIPTPPHAGVRALADLVDAMSQKVALSKAIGLARIGLRFNVQSSRAGKALLAALSCGRFFDIDLSGNRLDADVAKALAADLLAAIVQEENASDILRATLQKRAEAEPELDINSEIISLYSRAALLDETHQLTARAPAFISLDLADALAMPRCISVTEAARALATVSGETCEESALQRLVDANHLNMPERADFINLEAWTSFLNRVRATKNHGMIFRLDLRQNPLADAESALLSACREIRIKLASNTKTNLGTPENMLLLLESCQEEPKKARKRVPLRRLHKNQAMESFSHLTKASLPPPQSSSSTTSHSGHRPDRTRRSSPLPDTLFEGSAFSSSPLPPPTKNISRHWLLEAGPHDSIRSIETSVKDILDPDLKVTFKKFDSKSTLLTVNTHEDDFPWSWFEEELYSALDGRTSAIRAVDNLKHAKALLAAASPAKSETAPVKKVKTQTVIPRQDNSDSQPEAFWSASALKICKLLISFEDQDNDLRAAFNKFDASGDSELSVGELWRALVDLGPVFADLDKDEVHSVVEKHFDRDGDDHVSYEEFASFVRAGRKKLGLPSRQSFSEASMKLVELLVTYETLGNSIDDAFAQFDTSHDSEISRAELHSGLAKLGAGFKDISLDDIDSILKDACIESIDNHITISEFMAFVDRGRQQLHSSSAN